MSEPLRAEELIGRLEAVRVELAALQTAAPTLDAARAANRPDLDWIERDVLRGTQVAKRDPAMDYERRDAMLAVAFRGTQVEEPKTKFAPLRSAEGFLHQAMQFQYQPGVDLHDELERAARAVHDVIESIGWQASALATPRTRESFGGTQVEGGELDRLTLQVTAYLRANGHSIDGRTDGMLEEWVRTALSSPLPENPTP